MIIQERRYVALVDEQIALAESGKDFFVPTARAKRNYVELYNKNVDRIGLLHPELAEKIPTFYTYVNSLIEDLDGILDGKVVFPSRDAMYRSLVEFRDLLAKTILTGREIVSLVDEKYPESNMIIPG
ncbi:hypothetical protein WT13_14340 [Burkholderia anthina]|nr:hypothetical protein WT13_14340 [Burkholderia anthina]